MKSPPSSTKISFLREKKCLNFSDFFFQTGHWFLELTQGLVARQCSPCKVVVKDWAISFLQTIKPPTNKYQSFALTNLQLLCQQIDENIGCLLNWMYHVQENWWIETFENNSFYFLVDTHINLKILRERWNPFF